MKPFSIIITAYLVTTCVQAQTSTAPANSQTPAPVSAHSLTYKIPKGTGGGTRIDGNAGTRGGGVNLPSLYVLAPNHTGITTREQPSLFWYQSGASATRFELTLVEPKKPKPVLRVGSEKADQLGIHRIQLARHNITLTPGVCYKWTVALVPDPANRSQDIVASGTIQRLEPDAKLTSALADAKGLDKAAIYANHGIWYDALEAITNEIDASPKSKELRRQRAALLEQADLKDAAAADRK